MNVLLITISNIMEFNTISLIPIEELEKYNLDAINNGSVSNREDDLISEQIRMLFDRLGLEEYVTRKELEKCKKTGRTSFPFKSNQDLKQYINPEPLFTVDRVIRVTFMI